MLKILGGLIIIIAYFYHGYGTYGLEHRPLPKNTVTDFLAIESGGYSGQPVGPPKAGVQGATSTKAPTAPTQITTPSTPKLGTLSTSKSTSSTTKPTSATVIHSGNKVKSLVNFYDNQGKENGNSPGLINSNSHTVPKPFSYSAVVSGNKGSNNNLADATRHTSGPVVTNNGNSVRPMQTNIGSDKTQQNKNSNNPASTKPTMSYSGAVSGGGTRQNPTEEKKTVPTGIRGNTGQNHGKTTNKPINNSGAVSGSGKSTSRMPIPESSKTPTTPTVVGSSKGPEKSPVDASSISDSELKELSEEFLRKDTNNAAKLINPNYQGKTTSGSKNDAAPLPLLTNIPESVWQIPTIQTFIPLLDNYEKDTLVNEYVTPQEKAEENAFMDSIMSTAIMRRLVNFLKEKGIVTPDPKQQRDFIKQIWFNMYSRGRGKIGSSAFEHIFVSEVKNGAVSGLHNWIYFQREETANRANYLGHMKVLDLNHKGAIIKFHFNLQGIDKPVDTMFVGTSPELEMALYTLCYVARADRSCPLTLGGQDVNIKTYNYRYRSKNMIGSAYPEI